MPIRDHSDGHIKIVDHKTAAQFDAVLAYLVKDDQGGTYIAVGTQTLRRLKFIGADEAVTGMIFNFARKGKPADPVMTDEYGRKRNLPTIAQYKEALLALKRLDTNEEIFIESDLKGLKREDLAAIASKSGLKVWGDISKVQPAPLFWRESVERNKANRMRQIERIADDAEQMATLRAGQLGLTKNPGKHCAWCDFKDLCDIDENGGDSEQFIKDVYKVENPYADHEAGAINSKTSVQAKKETGVS